MFDKSSQIRLGSVTAVSTMQQDKQQVKRCMEAWMRLKLHGPKMIRAWIWKQQCESW